MSKAANNKNLSNPLNFKIMAAGEFTPSQLLGIKLKAEQMWQNSRFSADLTANAEAARAVLANQTASIDALSDRNKDNEVSITWIDPCAIVDEECESNCDLTETEMETKSQAYELPLCRKSGFAINAEKLRTNTYTLEEVTGKGLAAAIKVLDEYWARQTILHLKTFSGVNVSPEPYTFAGTTTTVPAAQYNRSMVAELMFDQMMNKMNGAYYIENGGLYVDWMNAKLDAGNLDGKGDMARVNALNMFFDPYNFATSGVSEDLFMVAPGAVALATKNRNPDAPTLIGGQVNHTVYTVQSQVLPGVRYDVYYTLKCTTVNGKANIVHTWRLETNGGLFLNPAGCPITIGATTYNPTGVLSYTKGS